MREYIQTSTAAAVAAPTDSAVCFRRMSDAIDNADVMLYGVSEQYKESGNCRLEANYGEHDRLQATFLAGLRCSHRWRCVAG